MTQVAKHITTPQSVTVHFDNEMRVMGQNQQFFKGKAADSRQRLWLKLTNHNRDYSQILVARVPGRSFGYDRGWDGQMLSANPNQAFYSLIDNEAYVIQAIPAFDPQSESHLIPLGVDAWHPSSYEISIDSLAAWPEEADIQLWDRWYNIYSDLKEEVYRFEVRNAQSFRNRFYLLLGSASPLVALRESKTPKTAVYWFRNQNGQYFLQFTEAIPPEAKVELMAADGRKLRELRLELNSQKQQALDLAGLPAGVYLIHFVCQARQLQPLKLYYPGNP